MVLFCFCLNYVLFFFEKNGGLELAKRRDMGYLWRELDESVAPNGLFLWAENRPTGILLFLCVYDERTGKEIYSWRAVAARQ